MNFKKFREKYCLAVCTILVVITICAILIARKNYKDYTKVSNNKYNAAFYELVEYMQDVENYLSKSLVTIDSGESGKTLTYVWREANLGEVYLSQIPISNEGLSNAQKFLNQVSEYSYTLSMKNMNGENLTQEELSKLKELYNYSVEINNTLSQLMLEINNGTLNWKELAADGSSIFEKEIKNMSKDSFNTIEDTFKEYDGLIYDGAYSDHITSKEKKGLTGNEIDEEQAKNIAQEFIGKQNVKGIISNGLSQNGDIKSYGFTISSNEENNNMTIAIAQKGGHIIFMNFNRNIEKEELSEDDADKKALSFLKDKGYIDMEKTYFIKQNGIMTINYAYKQDDVIVYPDLIKVKVALDNGQILGIETTGYLNNHEKRNINKTGIITDKEAQKVVNKDLKIENSRLAIIPTEYKTEKFCWELKGTVEEKTFLIYVNAKTGKVDDVLVLLQNENGTITG